MLSLFPQLLTFGLVAPTLLRLSVAVIGCIAGWNLYKTDTGSNKAFSFVYVACSILLGIGLYTQAIAIVGIVLIRVYSHIRGQTSTPEKQEMLLHAVLGVILLSLLFTGPGFLAIDKPL